MIKMTRSMKITAGIPVRNHKISIVPLWYSVSLFKSFYSYPLSLNLKKRGSEHDAVNFKGLPPHMSGEERGRAEI
jgi:hypothetical protein